MTKTSNPSAAVSAGNPCPFLRALVSSGELSDATEPIGHVAEVIVDVASRGEGHPALPRAVIAGIALFANGSSPPALLKTKWQGLQLNALRGGPLDKKGVGSGTLDSHGRLDRKQLARLDEYAAQKATADGPTEIGLGLLELRRYMDATSSAPPAAGGASTVP